MNVPPPEPIPDPLQKALADLFADPRPVEFAISRAELWCLILAVQHARRDPRFAGNHASLAELTARAMGDFLTAGNALLAQGLDLGWDTEFQQPGQLERAKRIIVPPGAGLNP